MSKDSQTAKGNSAFCVSGARITELERREGGFFKDKIAVTELNFIILVLFNISDCY